MRVEFLPPEQKIADKVIQIFKGVISRYDKENLTYTDIKLIEFDFAAAVAEYFNIKESVVPPITINHKEKYFSMPTGQYIYFIRKLWLLQGDRKENS